MATTELHKVPDTILSRCQEFEFRTIPLQKIFDRLKLIATAEKIDITDEALRELARSGEGSMRDAQSNFDQVISFSGDKITATDVTNALGFAGVEVLSKIIGAIAERDPRAALAVVDDLIARGHDLRNFCRDLLGLFRDMLVFKIAGNAGELLETAVFSGEELAAIASSFGETDLLRFFNSLCETEGSLRDAAHPRYVLEVGLIKLIEMQKVTSIESILERLDALSTGSPQPAPALAKTTGAATAAADVTSEKKTLKSEPPAFVPDIEFTDDPAIVEARTIYETPTADDLAEDWVRSRPVRLPPISSEALEHIEDQRLDDWYEDKLTFTGDDLKPLKSIATWLDKLFGVKEARAANAAVSNGNSGAAVAPAIDVSSIMPEMPRGDEEIDIPVLGENPTDEELIAYAQSHPSVRLAMRVFRAKIIEAKRS
jgi:DNA polymerase-3 subunit gamma/tau